MENVSAIGLQEGMGGLEESMHEFKRHHEDVGNKLMNLSGIGTATGQPVKKTEPRPGYVHQPFPMMVYHSEHGELIVNDADELQEARRQQYRDEPYLKPRVAVEDPATEKRILQTQLKQKDGEIAQLSDVLSKAMERLDKLEGAQFDQAQKTSKK